MTEQKTTPRKRTTRTKTQPTESIQVDQEVIIEKEVVEVKKRELQDGDKVILVNNVFGRYVYNPKQGMPFRMVEYGDEVEITYEQLKNMFRNDRNHVTKGYVYITDSDILKELNLEGVYNYMYTKEEVLELLDNPDELRNVLLKMPDVMKETFLSVAYNEAKEGRLNNYAIVRVIKDLTKVDITLNTTLNDWN